MVLAQGGELLFIDGDAGFCAVLKAPLVCQIPAGLWRGYLEYCMSRRMVAEMNGEHVQNHRRQSCGRFPGGITPAEGMSPRTG